MDVPFAEAFLVLAGYCSRMRSQLARVKPSAQKQLQANKNINPMIEVFSLSLDLQKRKRNQFCGILIYFVSVACCCGLCEPNMIITKANAKENLGECICLSTTKAKAK